MNGVILLAIVVTISILISVASNWLRGQQRKQEEQAAERRARGRAASGGGGAVKTGASDIDRFLEEINKLRQKPAAAEPASRPPRKAEPVRPAKPVAAPPVARRLDPPQPVLTPTPLPRLEDLPVAPVVARPLPPPPRAAGATRPIVMQPGTAVAPATPFARRFVGLLSDPKSVPMAVVLTEVLGPPKCKRV